MKEITKQELLQLLKMKKIKASDIYRFKKENSKI